MKIVAIDGGPRAGKTTALKRLKEEFGSQVFILKESATAILESGIDTPNILGEKYLEGWLERFQPIVYYHQNLQEWIAKVRAKREGAKLIIADRGTPGQAAYMPGHYPALERLAKMSREELLRCYDRVLLLTSTAVFDPDSFDGANNEKRYEDVATAQKIDMMINEAWSEHPKLTRIDYQRGIDGVVEGVVETIREMIEDECESKYLLKSLPKIDLPCPINIRQGYLPIAIGEHRARQADDRYFETYKMGSGAVRFQDERQISRKLFTHQLWPCTENHRLHKLRQIFPLNLDQGDFFLELDHLFNKGLVYLECEFDDDQQRQSLSRSILPDWAEDAIDVTDDDSHKAHNLANEN